MLDHKGFDLWADGYDRSVNLSDDDNTYPFAGYKRVLARIYEQVQQGCGTRVLDIGSAPVCLLPSSMKMGMISPGSISLIG